MNGRLADIPRAYISPPARTIERAVSFRSKTECGRKPDRSVKTLPPRVPLFLQETVKTFVHLDSGSSQPRPKVEIQGFMKVHLELPHFGPILGKVPDLMSGLCDEVGALKSWKNHFLLDWYYAEYRAARQQSASDLSASGAIGRLRELGDLACCSDIQIQDLVADLPREDLIFLVVQGPPRLRRKILRNLSLTARRMLLEEMARSPAPNKQTLHDTRDRILQMVDVRLAYSWVPRWIQASASYLGEEPGPIFPREIDDLARWWPRDLAHFVVDSSLNLGLRAVLQGFARCGEEVKKRLVAGFPERKGPAFLADLELVATESPPRELRLAEVRVIELAQAYACGDGIGPFGLDRRRGYGSRMLWAAEEMENSPCSFGGLAYAASLVGKCLQRYGPWAARSLSVVAKRKYVPLAKAIWLLDHEGEDAGLAGFDKWRREIEPSFIQRCLRPSRSRERRLELDISREVLRMLFRVKMDQSYPWSQFVTDVYSLIPADRSPTACGNRKIVWGSSEICTRASDPMPNAGGAVGINEILRAASQPSIRHIEDLAQLSLAQFHRTLHTSRKDDIALCLLGSNDTVKRLFLSTDSGLPCSLEDGLSIGEAFYEDPFLHLGLPCSLEELWSAEQRIVKAARSVVQPDRC